MKADKTELPQAFQITWIRSFYKASEEQRKPLNVKANKGSEMAGSIASIYISLPFQVRWELGSKHFTQKNRAQKVEMLYPVKQETFLKGEKAFHMISLFLSSSVGENIDIYQTVCSSFLISCSLFL